MRPGNSSTNPLPYNPGHGKDVFTLHDGPPYANGKLHMGHALNKLLKDMVLRDRRRQGYRAELLANWDCHGLPLEQRFAGKRDKFETTTHYLSVVERESRKWASLQSEQFQELGVGFDPSQSSLSCDPNRQALVMGEFHRLVEKGLVSRRGHPSSWSPVDQTVLAGAETVETEHRVPAATVLFPLEALLDEQTAYLAVWTTTPWSLPGNAGVAFNPDLAYALHVKDDKHVVALAGSLPDAQFVRDLTPEEMHRMVPRHPLHDAGYPFGVTMPCLLPAEFVSDTKGTGLVHVGPAHAMEDHALWLSQFGSLPFPDVVTHTGRYLLDLPLFGGMQVVSGEKLGEANTAVLAALHKRDMLLSVVEQTMTLEASWRSGGLLVTRPTDQWFVDLSTAKTRAVELVQNGHVKMVPARSKARFLAMLKNRPDWLVSRQREWGVPLGLYVNQETGAPEMDAALMSAVRESVRTKGLAGWWDASPEEHFTAAGRSDHAKFEKVTDVLDVWFDSACVQNYGQGTADLVVEGSDQHRGWYSSTLLKATALEDPLPFRTVLTHGFVVDADRRKMSKSNGNGTTPEHALKKWSRDVLRLWVAHVDVTEDVPFSPAVLEEAAQTRKAMRNTMRYLTGVLRNWSPEDQAAVPNSAMDLLLLAEVDKLVSDCNGALDRYDMRTRMELVRDFLDQRMSGFHLDARKDRLYCEQGSSAWHETRYALMYAYTALLDLLDPLSPDLVFEMRAACLPVRLAHGKPCPNLLAHIEPLQSLARDLVEKAKGHGLKLKDAEFHVGPEHQALVDAYGSTDLARLLKVDRLEKAPQGSLVATDNPECPRCRLHSAAQPDKICHRCTPYVPDKLMD